MSESDHQSSGNPNPTPDPSAEGSSDGAAGVSPGGAAQPEVGWDLKAQGTSDLADCQVELKKDGHRYVFRYATGEESKLLGDLMNFARDPGCPLNMFDVAVLSHQMGHQMGKQIQEMIKP